MLTNDKKCTDESYGNNQNTFYREYNTPAGSLTIAESGGSICRVFFTQGNGSLQTDYIKKETPVITEAHRQITEYFSGARKAFDLPLKIRGSAFYKAVWNALKEIPYGETRGYKGIAEALSKPGAARAVGLALNRNPFMIIIPCHRVIGKNGSLTGYAGGLEAKRFLLDLEKITLEIS